METAKIFNSGGSQAVRLPRKFRFDCDEVVVKKIGDMVLLYPKDKAFNIFLESASFTDDAAAAIEEARSKNIQAKREEL